MHPNPMAETSRLLFPSFRFCIAISPWVREHPFQSGWYGEMDGARFPDPANLLPDSVLISDFVHTRGGSAVRWQWRSSTQNGETDREAEGPECARDQDAEGSGCEDCGACAIAGGESYIHPRTGALPPNRADGMLSGHV
jgi:hypothetical protein